MPYASKTSDDSPKNGFSFSKLFKHVATVPTSIGVLYLFSFRTTDLGTFKDDPATTPIERIRKFLPLIASFSDEHGLGKKRVGLTPQEVSKLSDKEVEAIAHAYAVALPRIGISPAEAETTPKPSQEADEPATTYLNRLLLLQFENSLKQMQGDRERLLSIANGRFVPALQAEQDLRETRQEFEQLIKANDSASKPFPAEVHVPDFHHPMLERQASRERERAEEIAMVKLTGKMTAQSAQALETLVLTASDLMNVLDIRDKDAKRATNRQLWIAVSAAVTSTLLAIAALSFSWLTYKQDTANISSSDIWQSKVLKELQERNQNSFLAEANQRSMLETVNQLRAQVSELESRLAQSEAIQSKLPK